MPAVREPPSYSSTRVQRASRINGIEAARLLQQLQGIERAKQHQCRLTNQDIRLVSLSLDYIQSSSGKSPEAWRPPDDSTNSQHHHNNNSNNEEMTNNNNNNNNNNNDNDNENDNDKSEGPCFLYGERIISRKMRRVQRPMSAVERMISSLPLDDGDGCSVASDSTDPAVEAISGLSSSLSRRPKSSPSHQRRSSSASSWVRRRGSGRERGGEADDGDNKALMPSSADSTRHCGTSESDRLRLGLLSGPISSSGLNRTNAREAWEDDTTEATKKILKAQAAAQSGKRSNSIYVSAGDVMTSQASRKVRNLCRMIRMTATPDMETAEMPVRPSSGPPPDHPNTSISSSNNPADVTNSTSTSASTSHRKRNNNNNSGRSTIVDKPPQRPRGGGGGSAGKDSSLGRRATLGEILNQHKPTLSADSWKQHLRQSGVSPLSVSGQRQALLEAKKRANECQKAEVEKKVEDFVHGKPSNSQRWRRKSVFGV